MIARWFMMGGTDSLLTEMRPDLIGSMGGRGGLIDGQAMVATRAGAESGVLEEPFLLRFVMLEDGSIGGIGMGPASSAPPVDSGGAAIRKP